MTDQTKTALLSKLRAPVADERAADAAMLLGKYKALCLEIGRGDSYHLGRIDAAIAALASTPVAGEADERAAFNARYDEVCNRTITIRRIAWHLWKAGIAYAAPHASEAVRNQALAALESAQQVIRNGVEFGYIRMPDADTPDPAHRTPGLIDAAIRALSAQPGAQTHPHTDGGGRE